MTCHSLLVLVFGLSCFALSTCQNVGDMASLPILYPSKVLNTTQQGCPPDAQLETTRAEISYGKMSAVFCSVTWVSKHGTFKGMVNCRIGARVGLVQNLKILHNYVLTLSYTLHYRHRYHIMKMHIVLCTWHAALCPSGPAECQYVSGFCLFSRCTDSCRG